MTMHIKHEIGDRVRVAVPDHKRSAWAVGSVDALLGTVGTVERDRDWPGNETYLVRFDKPARTWRAHQTNARPPPSRPAMPAPTTPASSPGPAVTSRAA